MSSEQAPASFFLVNLTEDGNPQLILNPRINQATINQSVLSPDMMFFARTFELSNEDIITKIYSWPNLEEVRTFPADMGQSLHLSNQHIFFLLPGSDIGFTVLAIFETNSGTKVFEQEFYDGGTGAFATEMSKNGTNVVVGSLRPDRNDTVRFDLIQLR